MRYPVTYRYFTDRRTDAFLVLALGHFGNVHKKSVQGYFVIGLFPRQTIVGLVVAAHHEGTRRNGQHLIQIDADTKTADRIFTFTSTAIQGSTDWIQAALDLTAIGNTADVGWGIGAGIFGRQILTWIGSNITAPVMPIQFIITWVGVRVRN